MRSGLTRLAVPGARKPRSSLAAAVPLALLSALVCGVLTFVPTIGPTLATVLPLGVALLLSPALALQVLVLRLVLQNVEAFLITPILLSRTVNLLPTVALMAQLCMGVLLGLPGVLLALPLVVVLQVLCHGSNDRTGAADLPLLRAGSTLVGFMRPLASPATVRELAAYVDEHLHGRVRLTDMAALTGRRPAHQGSHRAHRPVDTGEPVRDRRARLVERAERVTAHVHVARGRQRHVAAIRPVR